MGPDGVSSSGSPSPEPSPHSILIDGAGVAAIPPIAARFLLHLKQHGVIYAVGWLVLDASGTWAALTAQAANVCG